MALRKIVLKSDEVLRKKCKTVEVFDEKLGILLDDMAETMYKANGVGLAAPQVGILRRVVVVDVGEGLLELVNPEIIKSKGTQRDVEGCLSCPNEWGYVVRPNEIVVKGQDRNGNHIQLRLKEFSTDSFSLILPMKWLTPKTLRTKERIFRNEYCFYGYS